MAPAPDRLGETPAAEGPLSQAQALLADYPWRDVDARRPSLLDQLERLRKDRQFALLAQLADRLARHAPADARVRRLQVQALIECGQPSAAIDVAQAALRRVDAGEAEWAELHGLLGRAWKQIFIDARRALAPGDLDALGNAVRAYRKPYEADPGNTWHAINLVAVAACAERMQLRRAPRLDHRALARQIVSHLRDAPAADCWHHATLAEAFLALGELDRAEHHLGLFLRQEPKDLEAFAVASTLRQFEQVWDLGSAGERERGLLEALRTRLMQLSGARLQLDRDDLQRLQQAPEPPAAQLEAILGADGTKSYRWWQTGLRSASSVASIRAGLDARIGTGFLVAAEDLGLPPVARALVLTNFHVVNAEASSGALRAEDASVVFEAADAERSYSVARIVWSSPVDRHDATLLELDAPPPAGVAPLPFARRLPLQPEQGRSQVYVIGHTGGGGLEFSFQDNELLDHEGPADNRFDGTPCRLHYRAPTEKGNSGSPVFNAADWRVIGLHHAGGVLSKLNGKPGTYPANEGIAMLSIIAALRGG